MEKTPLEIVNEMIASAEAYITELAEAAQRLENVLLKDNFIIVNASGFAINFDLVPSREHPGMSIAENPRVTQPHLAVRFPEGSAHTLARNVFDGNNVAAHAVPVVQAVAMAHEQHKYHLARLLEARDKIMAGGAH